MPQPAASLLAENRLGLHEPENLPQVAKHSSSQGMARPSQPAPRSKLADEAGRAQVGPVQVCRHQESLRLRSCRGKAPAEGAVPRGAGTADRGPWSVGCAGRGPRSPNLARTYRACPPRPGAGKEGAG